MEDKKRKHSLFYIYRTLINDLINERKFLVTAAVVSCITMTVLNYFPVVFQKRFINALSSGADIKKIGIMAGVYFAVLAIFSYINFFSYFYYQPRITLIRIDYIIKMAEKLMRGDLKYSEDSNFLSEHQMAFDSTSGNNNGYELLLKSIIELPPKIISIILLSFLIGTLSPIVLAALFLNVLSVLFVSGKVRNYRYSLKSSLSDASRIKYMSNLHMTDYNYGKDIRIYGLSGKLMRTFTIASENFLKISEMIFKREFSLKFLALLASVISEIATYSFIIYRIKRGLTAGELVMYLTAAASLNILLKDAVKEISEVLNEALYVDDALTFMNLDLNTEGGPITAVPEGKLEIELKNVTFRYPGTEKNIFTDFNLKIKKGEKLALVGINGAGKTTLVKLITGLFEPDGGEILVNGVNLKEFSKKTQYKMFSCVFQNFFILPYDIKTNVVINDGDDKEKTENCARHALKLSGLSGKVDSLERGIYQKLNRAVYDDAIDLSGGENQKMVIARALYKNAPVIIMDEPTASLDALAEQDIYQKFNELTGGKTALYISHRLASTKFCDRIVMLDEDRIGEEGTHDELMELKGKYYNMFKVQGKYYEEGKEEAI